jgi:hypothetical protein
MGMDEKYNQLALQLMRLKSADQWINQRGAIAFVFSKAGTGVYASKTATHRIGPGDILILSGATDGRVSADGKGDFLFRTFSLPIEQLFPLFESNEISLLKNVIDNLKSALIYAATAA